MIYQQAYEAFGKKETVNAAVIGAGQYGTAIVTQQRHTPRMRIVAVADKTAEAARKSYLQGGVGESSLAYCATAAEAEKAVEAGKFVYTDNSDIIPVLPSVDIVCEATGIPEASARYALDAIRGKKHVAMITKDCDAAVGPMLKKLADEAGVVYTPVDGDQHGLLIQMIDWARSVGLTVISAGKATDGEFVYDEKAGTVGIKTDKKIHPPFSETVRVSEEDAKYLQMIPEGKAAEYIERRAGILAGLPQPGSYDLCEMTIAANYTGFKPARDTLVHGALRITEIPVAYCEQEFGGIFAEGPTIDLATCFRRPDESGLGGGVFLVVRCDNAYSNHILTTKGQIANYANTAAVIYRPYHLCGVETSSTILVAGLLGLNTGSNDYRPRYDLVKVAGRDIKAGEVFENDHSPQLTARIVPALPIAGGNAAAAHLLTGNRAKVDIPKGVTVTYDMVEEPSPSVLWDLRRAQDKAFLS